VHEHEAGAVLATSSAIWKSKRKAEMSSRWTLLHRAPRRLTEDFVVSIEIGMEVSLAKLLYGTMRPKSLFGETVSAPGRVDSPPMSMMSAPSSIICSARLTAMSDEKNCRRR